MAKHFNVAKSESNIGSWAHSATKRASNISPLNQHGLQKTVCCETVSEEKIRLTQTRLTSESDSQRPNVTPKPTSVFAFLLYLKRCNFYNFALLLVVTVLTNSIYFNFFYLPKLHRSIQEQVTATTRPQLLPQTSNYFGNLISLSTLTSLITWPSLSYLSNPSTSSESRHPATIHLKSFDHVSFPPLDDGSISYPGSDRRDEETQVFAGLLDDSDFSTKKSNFSLAF